MKIIECPRDAMQGIETFIPTETKAAYINKLMGVGFDTIDFGSFVSPKAIPQMKDTHQLVDMINKAESKTKLLAIVANIRGAKDAIQYNTIDYLGYPLSLSETFQMRNTNRSIEEAFDDLNEIQNLCFKHNKTLVVYLSMGFGNPYDDPYNADFLATFTHRLIKMQVEIISLADTIGVSDKANISQAFEALVPSFPEVEFGAHLHARPDAIGEKVAAAYLAGCRRFDGAIRGYGGCPMAKDELVGNMATEVMIAYFSENNISIDLDLTKFQDAVQASSSVFLT